MNRYDFIFLFDAHDANPNGDPDAGNLPRVDAETGHGLVTDVCLKRKIRNFVQLTKPESQDQDGLGYDIYVREKAILNHQHARAYKALDLDPKKAKQPEVEKTRDWMCKNFYDIRTFGAVMTTDVNCGQVRGPVQLAFSRSIDPVVTSEFSVTRCAVTTEKEAEKQSGDNRTMGRKFTVPYALYRAHGFINPFLAAQTGFSDEDRELLFTALENAFQFDQSAARPAGSMAPRGLLVFEHSSQLGNAPSHALFDAVKVTKKPDVEVPRSFADYDVTIDESAIPDGINLIRRI
jgi:CRISPR-associated protein Csd2